MFCFEQCAIVPASRVITDAVHSIDVCKHQDLSCKSRLHVFLLVVWPTWACKNSGCIAAVPFSCSVLRVGSRTSHKATRTLILCYKRPYNVRYFMGFRTVQNDGQFHIPTVLFFNVQMLRFLCFFRESTPSAAALLFATPGRRVNRYNQSVYDASFSNEYYGTNTPRGTVLAELLVELGVRIPHMSASTKRFPRVVPGGVLPAPRGLRGVLPPPRLFTPCHTPPSMLPLAPSRFSLPPRSVDAVVGSLRTPVISSRYRTLARSSAFSLFSINNSLDRASM